MNTLGEVIKAAVTARLSEMHVALPARVLSYDASVQRVDVQPTIGATYVDEDGERRVEGLPVITSVPVMMPGAGGFRVTFPVKVDDTVLIVFSEASLDRWITQGGEVVDPNDDRRFALSDAIAIPGLRDFAHALQSAPTDRMTIGRDDGVQIHIDNVIKIGSNIDIELFAAVLGEVLVDFLGSFVTAYNAHTHGVSGAATLVPATLMTAPPNMLSTKVKVAQ